MITRLKITRREFALGTLALGTATLALGGAFVRPARADDPPLAELMAPNPLGEMAIGDAKAPITVIEYASMTCPHCAHFSETTYPELKKRYIDTGKVRFMFREFPLAQLAAAGLILARGAPPAKPSPLLPPPSPHPRQSPAPRPPPP